MYPTCARSAFIAWAPLVSLIAKPSNLPLQTTPFIGRERESAEFAGLIVREEVRLLTLPGAGGTGKTRLALQVGSMVLDAFERGVFFVNLAPLSDPALVPSTIASTLKVKEVPGEQILTTLITYLQDREMLLVLDNFEHLLNAVEVVARLLDHCPKLTILVTSRAVLHLSAEHEYAVPPLQVPDPQHLPELEELSQYDAVALFIERARAVKPSFLVTNRNAPAVAEICHRLDGLPLAIELAAARIRYFPPPALLQRLSNRLKLLTSGATDRPSRQQTLRNTIDWSYHLLSEDEQALFARLSVFAGGCTFEAAEAVCNADGALDLLDGMADLVDKSLLKQEGDEPRLAMLETIREFATERLAEGNEQEQLRDHHAAYCLAMAEKADPKLPRPREWLARLDTELDNLRAALGCLLQCGRIEEELRLVVAISPLLSSRGHWGEVRRWLEEGLAQGQRVAAGVRARSLGQLGYVAHLQGDHGRAVPALEEALRLFRELGDQRGTAWVLNALALVAGAWGEYERANALTEESLRLYQESGDRRMSAAILANLGGGLADEGNLSGAKEHTQEALKVLREVGDRDNIAFALQNLGEIALREGNLAEAEARLEESLALSRELGNKQTLRDLRCAMQVRNIVQECGCVGSTN